MRFSSMKAMWSPGFRPAARRRWASWFDRSSSWRYVSTSPVAAITTAGLSGVVAAMAPGNMARPYPSARVATVGRVDPGARFAELVLQAEDDVPLAETALLVAAHAHPALDLHVELARLDGLASSCPAPTLDALLEHLFVRVGFAGNRDDYYDPENSYLDSVLQRRVGIPLTLSIVLMEVGGRLRVPLVGVGMPGHFLVRPLQEEDTFIDAFDGGTRLDRLDCERRHREVQGGAAPFDERLLRPVGTWAVLARLLANLKG